MLLPECALGDAMLRAEQIRARIEALSEVHGLRITASLGVSSYPETAGNSSDLIRTADVALYEAKHAGRNCVAFAGVRTPREDSASAAA